MEIEATINFLLATEPEHTHKVSLLKPEYFTDETQRKICKIIKDRYEKGLKTDMVVLADELQDESNPNSTVLSQWLENASVTSSTSFLDTYILDVKNKAYKRNMSHIFNQYLEDGDKGKFQTARIKIDTEFGAELGSRPTVTFKDMAFETYENAGENPEKYGIGFTAIDDNVPLMAGNLMIIAARPSTGKTAVMLQSIVNSSQKYPVGVISLEMSRNEIGARMAASMSGLPANRILHGDLSDKEVEKLGISFDKYKDLPIFVNDQPNMKMEQLKEIAKDMRTTNDIKCLYIDYLGLIEGDKNKKQYENVTMISKQLKQLAREIECPVVCLAQLNRDIEKRGKEAKPMLSDLRDSGAIEQDADVIAMLHRDEENLEFIIRKNRNGPLFTSDLQFDLKTQKIIENNFV